MSLAGVQIAGGFVYFVVAEEDSAQDAGVRVTAMLPRGQWHPDQPVGRQLADLAARVSQDLRTHRVTYLGLVETRLFSNWKYSDALARISIISGVMLGAHQAGVDARTIKTEAISPLVLRPANKLSEADPNVFGLSGRPTYWSAGFAAAAGASAAVRTPL